MKFLFQREKKNVLLVILQCESYVHINVLLSPGPMKMVQKVSLGRHFGSASQLETYNFKKMS